jgi:hypothetical protein
LAEICCIISNKQIARRRLFNSTDCGDYGCHLAVRRSLTVSRKSALISVVGAFNRKGLAMDTFDSAATLARAEQIVDVLRTRYIRDGWRLNEQWATKFLDAVRRPYEGNGDSEEMTVILEWMSAHGQSLDWLWLGNPGSMICMLGSLAPPPLSRAYD